MSTNLKTCQVKQLNLFKRLRGTKYTSVLCNSSMIKYNKNIKDVWKITSKSTNAEATKCYECTPLPISDNIIARVCSASDKHHKKTSIQKKVLRFNIKNNTVVSKNVFSTGRDHRDILQKPNMKGRDWLGISLLCHVWGVFVFGFCLKTTKILQTTMSPLLGTERGTWNSSILVRRGIWGT